MTPSFDSISYLSFLKVRDTTLALALALAQVYGIGSLIKNASFCKIVRWIQNSNGAHMNL
jgi:hypothetical protein